MIDPKHYLPRYLLIEIEQATAEWIERVAAEHRITGPQAAALVREMIRARAKGEA